MNHRTSVLILVSTASLAAAGVLWNAVRTRRATSAHHADCSAQMAALDARRTTALQELAAVAASTVSGRPRPPSNSPSSAPLHAAAAKRPRSITPAQMKALEDAPDLQLLKQEADRSLRHIRYAAFVRIHTLSAGQCETLDRILNERDTRLFDLRRSLEDQGLSATDPAAQALRAEITNGTTDTLRALLGDAGAEDFSTYERTVDLRQVVAAFSVAATMIGEPLDATQVEQLVHVLAESDATYLAGNSASISGIDWSVAEPRLQALLTPVQYAQISQTDPDAVGGTASRFSDKLMREVMRTLPGGRR